MKPLLLLSLLGTLLLTGCATRYTITLTNGGAITAHSKPRLEGGAYVFQDATGKTAYVSAGRVSEISRNSLSFTRRRAGDGSAPSR
jgi:hypothetical protein